MTNPIETLIELTAQEFGVTQIALKGQSRCQVLAIPRFAAWHLAWKHLGMTHKSIAVNFGKRHASTIHYGHKQAHRLLLENGAFAEHYHKIERKLAQQPAA